MSALVPAAVLSNSIDEIPGLGVNYEDRKSGISEVSSNTSLFENNNDERKDKSVIDGNLSNTEITTPIPESSGMLSPLHLKEIENYNNDVMTKNHIAVHDRLQSTISRLPTQQQQLHRRRRRRWVVQGQYDSKEIHEEEKPQQRNSNTVPLSFAHLSSSIIPATKLHYTHQYHQENHYHNPLLSQSTKTSCYNSYCTQISSSTILPSVKSTEQSMSLASTSRLPSLRQPNIGVSVWMAARQQKKHRNRQQKNEQVGINNYKVIVSSPGGIRNKRNKMIRMDFDDYDGGTDDSSTIGDIDTDGSKKDKEAEDQLAHEVNRIRSEPEDELEQRANQIRAELFQTEARQLALEAERAAEAGKEKFTGQFCTYNETNASALSPLSSGSLTPPPRNVQRYEQQRQHQQQQIYKSSQLPTTAVHPRNSLYTRPTLTITKATSSSSPFTAVKNYRQSDSKLNVLKLRDIDEVIPKMNNLHFHLKTHMRNNCVDVSVNDNDDDHRQQQTNFEIPLGINERISFSEDHDSDSSSASLHPPAANSKMSSNVPTSSNMGRPGKILPTMFGARDKQNSGINVDDKDGYRALGTIPTLSSDASTVDSTGTATSVVGALISEHILTSRHLRRRWKPLYVPPGLNLPADTETIAMHQQEERSIMKERIDLTTPSYRHHRSHGDKSSTQSFGATASTTSVTPSSSEYNQNNSTTYSAQHSNKRNVEERIGDTNNVSTSTPLRHHQVGSSGVGGEGSLFDDAFNTPISQYTKEEEEKELHQDFSTVRNRDNRHEFNTPKKLRCMKQTNFQESLHNVTTLANNTIDDVGVKSNTFPGVGKFDVDKTAPMMVNVQLPLNPKHSGIVNTKKRFDLPHITQANRNDMIIPHLDFQVSDDNCNKNTRDGPYGPDCSLDGVSFKIRPISVDSLDDEKIWKGDHSYGSGLGRPLSLNTEVLCTGRHMEMNTMYPSVRAILGYSKYAQIREDLNNDTEQDTGGIKSQLDDNYGRVTEKRKMTPPRINRILPKVEPRDFTMLNGMHSHLVDCGGKPGNEENETPTLERPCKECLPNLLVPDISSESVDEQQHEQKQSHNKIVDVGLLDQIELNDSNASFGYALPEPLPVRRVASVPSLTDCASKDLSLPNAPTCFSTDKAFDILRTLSPTHDQPPLSEDQMQAIENFAFLNNYMYLRKPPQAISQNILPEHFEPACTGDSNPCAVIPGCNALFDAVENAVSMLPRKKCKEVRLSVSSSKNTSEKEPEWYARAVTRFDDALESLVGTMDSQRQRNKNQQNFYYAPALCDRRHNSSISDFPDKVEAAINDDENESLLLMSDRQFLLLYDIPRSYYLSLPRGEQKLIRQKRALLTGQRMSPAASSDPPAKTHRDA